MFWSWMHHVHSESYRTVNRLTVRRERRLTVRRGRHYRLPPRDITISLHWFRRILGV